MRYREPGVEIHALEAVPDDIEGQNQAWWGLATLHVKAQDGDCPLLLANELICCRLAAALGLPVLPGEIANLGDGRKGWATPQIRANGVSAPPPSDVNAILDKYDHIAAGALVFDTWIQNDDRHLENFLFHPNLGIWLIDHEESLLGRKGEHFGGRTDTPLRYHQFSDATLPEDALNYWINRVRMTSDSIINLAVDEAYDRGLLIPKPRAGAVKVLLKQRGGTIESLVKALRKTRPRYESAKVISFPSATVASQLTLS
ncbi:hypothetical protein [Nocardia camponoti]|uniref:Uncharacterized protein n=1 Tax=Nocardia camponoti TaxID=1616106 RepID=A0A917VAN4_9NOCA|nr:hypothetical protein [Nocardia camponoti]GGK54861.1 hypothetical protein GCM10011591_28420 [Nocardia camponoti]